MKMKEPITKVKRNYGIDMLRLIAMFFVVILHVLGHGGAMKNATGYNYNVSSLLLIGKRKIASTCSKSSDVR